MAIRFGICRRNCNSIRICPEHVSRVQIALNLLRITGFELKLITYRFFTKTGNRLGHVNRLEHLQTASHTVDAIKKGEKITKFHEAPLFCRTVQLIPKIRSQSCTPLGALKRQAAEKSTKNFQTSQQKELASANALNIELILSFVLTLPNTIGHMALATDAWYIQVGSVLLKQQQDGTTKPFGNWSRSLINAKREYDTAQRDCLANVWEVLQLRP